MNTREHTSTPTHTLVHSLSHSLTSTTSTGYIISFSLNYLPINLSGGDTHICRSDGTCVSPPTLRTLSARASRRVSDPNVSPHIQERDSLPFILTSLLPSLPTPLQSLSQNAYQKTTVKKDAQKYRYKKVKESFQRPCFWLAGTNDVIWVWVWD